LAGVEGAAGGGWALGGIGVLSEGGL
jgi:hypothetical protein